MHNGEIMKELISAGRLHGVLYEGMRTQLTDAHDDRQLRMKYPKCTEVRQYLRSEAVHNKRQRPVSAESLILYTRISGNEAGLASSVALVSKRARPSRLLIRLHDNLAGHAPASTIPQSI